MCHMSLIINSDNKKNAKRFQQIHFHPATHEFSSALRKHASELAHWKKSFNFENRSQSFASTRIQSDFNFCCDRFPII
jgi:hypothetical protein